MRGIPTEFDSSPRWRMSCYAEFDHLAVEEALRAIAPADLAGRGCYVVDADQAGLASPFPGWLLAGMTDPQLDLFLMPGLRATGRWKGRGFATVLFPGTIAAARPLTPRRWHMLAIGLHELAHDLAGPAEGHGPQWIRAGCHLAARATAAGFNCQPSTPYIAGEDYARSPAEFYARTLGAEVSARFGEPIQTILKSPPPAAFTRMAQLDDQAFGQRREAMRRVMPPGTVCVCR